MELHVLKQWLTGGIALPGVDLQSGKTDKLSTTSDRHRKKEDNQNHQNIADIPRPFFVLKQKVLALRKLVILTPNIFCLNLLYVVV